MMLFAIIIPHGDYCDHFHDSKQTANSTKVKLLILLYGLHLPNKVKNRTVESKSRHRNFRTGSASNTSRNRITFAAGNPLVLNEEATLHCRHSLHNLALRDPQKIKTDVTIEVRYDHKHKFQNKKE